MTRLLKATAPHLVRRALLTTAALTALFVAASAAVPEPAHAFPTSVGDLIGETVEALFGDGNPLNAPFIEWLITVPNPAADYPAIGTLGRMTSAIGFALLGAVITVSVISYWAAGFTGGGGDILAGATRTAGVGLFIIAWPWIHESGVALVNIVSQAVLPNEDMDQLMQLTDMHTASLITLRSLGWIYALILLPIIVLMMLGLTLTKVGLDAGVFVSYVAVPIAVPLSMVPGLAWLPQFTLRTATAVVIAPLSWAFLLAVFTMLGTDVLRVRAETVGFPERMMGAVALAGVALLMFKLPTMILRQAGVAPPNGGFFKQALAFMASQFAFRSIGRHVPDKFGGSRDSRMARQNSVAARRWAGDLRTRVNQNAGDMRDAVRKSERALEASEKVERDYNRTSRGNAEQAGRDAAQQARRDAARQKSDLQQKHREFAASEERSIKSVGRAPTRAEREAAQAWGEHEKGAQKGVLPSADARGAGLTEYNNWAADPSSQDSPVGGAYPKPGAPATVGGVGYEYGRLAPYQQELVQHAVHSAGSRMDTRAAFGALESSMQQDPAVTPQQQDAVRALSKADHDLLSRVIPGNGSGPRPAHRPAAPAAPPASLTAPPSQGGEK